MISAGGFRYSNGIVRFSIILLTLSVKSHAASESHSRAQDLAIIEFNDALLQRSAGGIIDLARFSKRNPVAPGQYRADIYVNDVWIGRSDVRLKQISDDADNVQPCFDRAMIERLGVDLSRLSEEATTLLAPSIGEGLKHANAEPCIPLPALIPLATSKFDSGDQRLDVSIPQAAMNRNARGYVDPRYWDDGMPAALLQYNTNYYQTDAHGLTSSQGYAGLTAGGNLGPWRFRHTGNFSYNDRNGSAYQGVQTNLQRSIASLKSQLVLGDAFTSGALFDSIGFRGLQLGSDDRMYPDSQRGYAPTVRGIANTNALVQVRQNGNIIYESNVATGPFEISDLYPTGYGGDLEVTIREADGSVRRSFVPYAATANALRHGITHFDFSLGTYRDPRSSAEPLFFEGTFRRGLSNTVTGYVGTQVSSGYISGLVGAALNTSIGAFGFDITTASAELPGRSDRSGQSVRLAYSKQIEATDTNITVAAYRYSSSGYLNLRDAVSLREPGRTRTDEFALDGIQRSRLQLTVNQRLPDGYGAFYLSGSTQNYWSRGGRDTQFQAGYNNSFRQVNYGVSVSRQYDVTRGRWDNQLGVSFSLPLGSTSHAPYLLTTLQRDSNGSTQLQQSLSGGIGLDNALTYGINAGQTSGNSASTTRNVGGNLTYRSPIATVSANGSKGDDYSQVGVGTSGGVVAYEGGFVFTPSMGETLAIVEAKDAGGARVTNSSGLRVDPWGHAIVSSLTPFATNEIELDPNGLPLTVELKSTSQRIAPTAGAIVRMKFETEGGGAAVLVTTKSIDNKPLPFGATVMDIDGQHVGTIAQAGRLVLRSVKRESGVFTVKWGDDPLQQCQFLLSLPKSTSTDRNIWTTTDVVCKK